MFAKLLNGLKSKQVKPETQREILARALREVNAILAELPQKPAIGFDPESGEISLTLPEYLPDEALALPAPENDAQKRAA